jgi:hypothetical protein
MDEAIVTRLREHAESLAAPSTIHLSADTRRRLLGDDLSVNAYPTGDGGFLYVGIPRYAVPAENDLAALFESPKGRPSHG